MPTLSVTVDRILKRVPLDTSGVSTTSEPLTTSDVEEFRDEAIKQVEQVITSAGITISDVKSEGEKAVIYHAIAEVLSAVNETSLARDFTTKYDAVLSSLFDGRHTKGDASPTRPRVSKPDDDKMRLDFSGMGYEF